MASPTITSRGRAAFLVLLEIRSSRMRVVTTMMAPLAGGRAGGQQRGNGGDAGERPRFVSGPEPRLLAVGGDGRIHEGERTADPGRLESSRRQPHARLPRDALLRVPDQRLDVAQRRIEVLSLVQPVAVEAAALILPERLPAGEHQLLELAVRVDQQERRAGL